MHLFKTPTVAIDLGTSNTMVYVAGKGIVISEPTLVVVMTADKHVVRAVGDEARYQMGRTTEALTAVSPIVAGVIDDFDAAEAMLRYFLQKAVGSSNLRGPHVVMGIPAGLATISRKAVLEATRYAGAKKVTLIEKPLAAAIGTGLQVYDPFGNMVVDVGGGTTDIAVVSIGGMVVSRSIPVGGKTMDEGIINYLKQNSSLSITPQVAEEVKIDLASAMPLTDDRKVQIRGRDLYAAHALNVEFSTAQAHDAVVQPCQEILEAIKWVLERTPPELAADIMRNGIHLTGAGAKLFALDQFIGRALGIPVFLARNPEDCTITGLGHLVENPDLLEMAAGPINE